MGERRDGGGAGDNFLRKPQAQPPTRDCNPQVTGAAGAQAGGQPETPRTGGTGSGEGGARRVPAGVWEGGGMPRQLPAGAGG